MALPAVEDRIGTTEVAALVGVSPQTIMRWVNKGHSTIPKPRRLSTRMMIWERKEIQDWIDKL